MKPGEVIYGKPGEELVMPPEYGTQVLDVESPTSTELPPKPEIVAMPSGYAPYDESVLTEDQKTFLRETQKLGATYQIPEHAECKALRPNDGLKYGVVVHTSTVNEQGQTIITRYCHCRFCRPWSSLDSRIEYRYKDVQIIKHPPFSH